MEPEQNNQDPTEQLRSLLNETLRKSESNDDDGDGYDAENMKKYMKRFMKENQSFMKDCLKNFDEAKDLRKSLQSSFDSIDPDTMNGADAIMIDGTEILGKAIDMNSKMVHVTENLLDGIAQNYVELKSNREILNKACAVILNLTDKLNKISHEPLLQKSVTSFANQSIGNNASPIVKAKELGYAKIKERLFKSALADSSLNPLVGMLDSCNGFLERIEPNALSQIVAIASKEG
jgi:hypothetical protein